MAIGQKLWSINQTFICQEPDREQRAEEEDRWRLQLEQGQGPS